MASQAFLPVFTPDNRIVGVIPIAAHTFDGTETTYTVNAVARPVRKVVINQSQRYNNSQPSPNFVVGIDMTRAQEVSGAYYGFSTSFLSIGSVWPFYEWSDLQSSAPTQQESLGNVFTMLFGGVSLTVSAPAASTNPTVSTPKSLTWTAVAPIANAPVCSYFDFNWVSLFSAAGNSNVGDPPTITVTSQPSGPLKAYVVATPEPGGPQGGPVYNTVRIMKVGAAAIDSSSPYAFVFSISNTSGLTASATLNLTVTT